MEQVSSTENLERPEEPRGWNYPKRVLMPRYGGVSRVDWALGLGIPWVLSSYRRG